MAWHQRNGGEKSFDRVQIVWRQLTDSRLVKQRSLDPSDVFYFTITLNAITVQTRDEKITANIVRKMATGEGFADFLRASHQEYWCLYGSADLIARVLEIESLVKIRYNTQQQFEVTPLPQDTTPILEEYTPCEEAAPATPPPAALTPAALAAPLGKKDKQKYRPPAKNSRHDGKKPHRRG